MIHYPAFFKAGGQNLHFFAFLKADKGSSLPRAGRLGTGGGLYLQCWLDGQPCTALVDTGTTISLVRPGILRGAHWEPTNMQLQSITGQKMSMKGWKRVSVAMGDRRFNHQFWLDEIREDCIMGLDLLARWGSTVGIACPALVIGATTYDLPSTVGKQTRKKKKKNMATAVVKLLSSRINSKVFLAPLRLSAVSICNYGAVVSSSGEKITHTGQVYDEQDVRRARFVDRQKEVNERFAINLVAEEPVTNVQARVVSCDGGGGALGHPKVYINLDKETQAGTCGYCGLRFQQKHQH
ncbi:hypothetical protein GJAV_G00097980 [Gymnothorax javanicus]|nr:hypothetical protein GJAV_G00097980 [Gymnothorax javanicus]